MPIQRNEIVNYYFLDNPIHTKNHPLDSLLIVALPLKGPLDELGVLRQRSQSRQDIALPLVPMHHVARVDSEVEKGRIVDKGRHSFPLDFLCGDVSQASLTGWKLAILEVGPALPAFLKGLLILRHDYGRDDGVLGGDLLRLERVEVVREEMDSFPYFVLSDDMVVSLRTFVGAAPGHHIANIIDAL